MDKVQIEKEQKLHRVQRRLVITCLVLVIAFIGIKLIEIFSDLVHIIAISVFVTYTVISLVDFLHRRLKNRMIAVLSVYILGALLTLVGILLVVPTILFQFAQLIQLTANELPKLIQNSGDFLKPLETRLSNYDIHISTDQLTGTLINSLPNLDGSFIIAQMSGVAVSTMSFAVYSMSILVLSFYFLLDGGNMVSSYVKLFPVNWQKDMRPAVSEINACLQAFFRGQIVLGLLFGVFMVIVYMVLGVEYALALGLLLGIWEIVPVIGPTIGFIPALVSVSFLGMSNINCDRVFEIIILIVVFNVFQWIKDNVVAPKYIGDAIGLHPVLIFIAIMVGARLDGILGIIVSLPVAGMIAVMFRYATGHHQDHDSQPKETQSDSDSKIQETQTDDQTSPPEESVSDDQAD